MDPPNIYTVLKTNDGDISIHLSRSIEIEIDISISISRNRFLTLEGKDLSSSTPVSDWL